MKEENSTSSSRMKASKYGDQNKAPKGNSNNVSKVRSSWGSQIVKGLSGDTKKSTTTLKNNSNSTTRVKRSLMGDLSCSATSIQVHPQSLNKSRDLFLEIDHLRSLLQDSKARELKLQSELSKTSPKVVELQREMELKKTEIHSLLKKVELLEREKDRLTATKSNSNCQEFKAVTSLEMEVVELRRLNKELQLQKRDIACRLSSLESCLALPQNVSQGNTIEEIKAEASLLRHTNENLCKQVEGLQMSRLNEVEELAYLRWVNSCLREELSNSSSLTCDKTSSPHDSEKSRESLCLSYDQSDEESKCSSARRLSLIKKLKKWPITDEDMQLVESPNNIIIHSLEDTQSSNRRTR